VLGAELRCVRLEPRDVAHQALHFALLIEHRARDLVARAAAHDAVGARDRAVERHGRDAVRFRDSQRVRRRLREHSVADQCSNEGGVRLGDDEPFGETAQNSRFLGNGAALLVAGQPRGDHLGATALARAQVFEELDAGLSACNDDALQEATE
jgi:hypothetical protein